MAFTNVITAGATEQAPPIVTRLQQAFDKLDDEPLIQALIGPTRRGPKGHPIKVLWRCFVTKYLLGIDSTDAFIRELNNNPFVARSCGIDSPDGIPHKSTFSRFLDKISKRDYLAKVKDVSRSLVRHHYASLPGFGKRVALDASVVKGWSNGGKTPKADQEAGWSVKKGTQGTKEFVYGYKLHLLVDCEYELPIAANISAGNVHDSKRASRVLSEARFSIKGFRPQYLMADKGYSGLPLRRLLDRAYDIKPIIQTNPGHKKLMAKEGLVENTPEWKALYKQRQAVERCFSRLKGQRSLNKVTVRSLRKVTAHCYLSLIAMQVVV